MKSLAAILAAIIGLELVPAAPAAAGVIERACRLSDSPSATPELCSCIQEVADRNLNMFERRKVAKWFNDPDLSQKARQSHRKRDRKLWERYKAFGEEARQTCG